MPRKKDKTPPVTATQIGTVAISATDIKVSEINKTNKVAMATLRQEVLRSGLVELAVKMALTGREFYIDEFGEVVESDEMLSPASRLSLINKIIDKTISTPKESDDDEKEDDGMQRWYEIGQKLSKDLPQEQDTDYDS